MCSIPTLIDREKSKPDRWSKQTLSIGFIVFPFIFTYGIYLIKVAWVSSSMFLMFLPLLLTPTPLPPFMFPKILLNNPHFFLAPPFIFCYTRTQDSITYIFNHSLLCFIYRKENAHGNL